MKITCKAQDLGDLVKVAKVITAKRTILPANKCVTMEVTEAGVVVRATDMEIMMVGNLDATVIDKKDGKVQLLATVLSDFLKREKGNITIETVEGKKVALSSDSAKLVASQEYLTQDVPVPETGLAPTNLGSEFVRKVGWAWPYSTDDDSRPVLTAVCLSEVEGQLQLAGADGFRLIRVVLDTVVPKNMRINVPRECCQLVSRFMTGDISMGYNDQRVWFQSDKLKITSQLAQGSFPQYNSLIPTQTPVWTAKMSAPLLQNRLLQFKGSVSGRYGITRFVQQGEFVKLLTRTGDEVHYEALIPAEMSGDGRIALNPEYLLPPCSIFSEMVMEVTNTSSPIKIHGDLAGVTVVIMPMFVQWDA